MSADVHGLVGAYAVDAVDDEERAAFERHLAECPECRAEVASLQEAASHLSLTTATPAPEAMRANVLAGIKAIRPLPPVEGTRTQPPAEASSHGAAPSVQGSARVDEPSNVVPLRRRPRLATWLTAAAAAAAIVVGGTVWSPWDDGAEEPRLTATEQVLRADDAQRYEKVIDGARATIVRSASLGRAVIIADNMPPAPAGKDFQVWFDVPGQGMVSAGVMPHEAKPTLTMLLEGDAAKATGAGITLEPAGGSPAPTGEPIALIAFT
jgi:anti-sigma-K factor RskA